MILIMICVTVHKKKTTYGHVQDVKNVIIGVVAFNKQVFFLHFSFY